MPLKAVRKENALRRFVKSKKCKKKRNLENIKSESAQNKKANNSVISIEYCRIILWHKNVEQLN